MSTTITVTSAAELNQALSQATGGETILLAPGDYGKLSLKGAQFASEVTIKSADPANQASFSEMYLTNSSNITFDEITFDYTYSLGDATYTNKFLISGSSNITIDNSLFDGDFASGTGTSADGTGFGKGLVIRGSNNVEVTNTEFHSWWKALGAGRSTDINFSGNNIHTIRSDGISLGEVQNVLIENNYIHDFGGAAGSNDHRDMIQVQRSNGTGSSDIIIRNNVLDMGEGDYTQGIWFGGDKGQYSNPEDWHYNVVIENNIIYNAHANGLAVHMTEGLEITNNTLIAVPSGQTGGVAIPKILVTGGSKDVTIEQNITPTIVGPSVIPSDWTIQDNAIIQPNNYDAHFIFHETAANDGYNQYGILPGTIADLLDAGSSLVDSYPFDYDSWVGVSSSTVVNSGSTGSTTTTTGTTAPDSGTSTTTAPDSGTSTTTAPDSGTSTTTAPDSGTSTTTAPDSGTSTTTAPDSGTSTTTAPDSGTSTTTAPDSGTSTTTAPDSGTSTTTAPDSGTSTTTAPDSGTSTTTVPDSGTSTPTAPDSGTSSGSTGTNTGTGSQTPMVFDDYVLDIAGLATGNDAALKGDAHVVDTATGPVVHFDGYKDQVKLGRLKQFEDSEQLAFSVEFARDEADGAAQRLVWNKGHVGLTLVGDGLKVHVKNNDGKFHEGFHVKDLGLNDTEAHEISVLVDEVEDRVQVIVDDEVVLDRTDIDLDFTGGREWGWDIGFSHGRYADGDLSGFAIDDEVQFVDPLGGTVSDLG
ncbi:right-handed parallel beta-helix repeat-containing protein [Ruegeria sp. HKCCA5763]|uniref:right-handed parallel beta-helix repeat-containing protein n=1 Tax=Ruegeria sp. HKCCA5763 TaxID=2682987 RepID=UPI0014879EC8|nr:right-handed parallel beta-helix repeat-containing protein [Ruegeria sp. HKCCA5763]